MDKVIEKKKTKEETEKDKRITKMIERGLYSFSKKIFWLCLATATWSVVLTYMFWINEHYGIAQTTNFQEKFYLIVMVMCSVAFFITAVDSFINIFRIKNRFSQSLSDD